MNKTGKQILLVAMAVFISTSLFIVPVYSYQPFPSKDSALKINEMPGIFILMHDPDMAAK